MKRFFINILIISAVITMLAGTVSCGYRWKTPEERADWIAEKISDELNLTADQQVKLNDLKAVMLNAQKEMREQRLEQRDQILVLLESPSLNRQALNTMFDKNISMMEKHRPGVVDATADFYDSLSDEQRNKLREYYQRYTDDWERYGHHHRHHYWW